MPRRGDVVAIRSLRQIFAPLVLTGAALAASTAVQAGPEVTLYLTLPLGGPASNSVFGNHVFGLRLDKNSAPPNVRVINPESPLNRRPLMDLQLGADSALRLDLARRLTWDISRQELRQSSRPASFTVRLPVNDQLRNAVSPAHNTPSNSIPPVDTRLLTAALANPFQNSEGKAAVKGLPVEP